jgi:hypothetical protein
MAILPATFAVCFVATLPQAQGFVIPRNVAATRQRDFHVGGKFSLVPLST